MLDETQQPIPEPSQPEPILTPSETPISEPTSQPLAPSESAEQVPIPPAEPTPPEMPPEPTGAAPSPEDTTPVRDDISANEPFDSAQDKPSEPAPEPLEKPGITIEKHGTDTTITEVMEQPETPTAQMAGNEPIDLAEEIKIKQREENLKLANETRQEKKQEKINKILTLFSEKSQITNDEVEKLLHVSDATATRYLDELEKEGKIKQVGKTGKHTHYEKI